MDFFSEKSRILEYGTSLLGKKVLEAQKVFLNRLAFSKSVLISLCTDITWENILKNRMRLSYSIFFLSPHVHAQIDF